MSELDDIGWIRFRILRRMIQSDKYTLDELKRMTCNLEGLGKDKVKEIDVEIEEVFMNATTKVFTPGNPSSDINPLQA